MEFSDITKHLSEMQKASLSEATSNEAPGLAQRLTERIQYDGVSADSLSERGRCGIQSAGCRIKEDADYETY